MAYNPAMGLEQERANNKRLAYRDASGRALTDYPRPSVAVDTAVLTVAAEGNLSVVLVRPSADDDSSARGRHRLPGTFLHEGERLSDAVLRSLDEKVGVRGLGPRQLHVFDELDRDDRGWVLSVAHVVTIAVDELDFDRSKAVLVTLDRLPALAYRHEAIVALAVGDLRAEYARGPDPRRLLQAPFTLRDLHSLHEAIAGMSIPRDSFRRAMEGDLVETGEARRGIVGKPARLFNLRTRS